MFVISERNEMDSLDCGTNSACSSGVVAEGAHVGNIARACTGNVFFQQIFRRFVSARLFAACFVVQVLTLFAEFTRRGPLDCPNAARIDFFGALHSQKEIARFVCCVVLRSHVIVSCFDAHTHSARAIVCRAPIADCALWLPLNRTLIIVPPGSHLLAVHCLMRVFVLCCCIVIQWARSFLAGYWTRYGKRTRNAITTRSSPRKTSAYLMLCVLFVSCVVMITQAAGRAPELPARQTQGDRAANSAHALV